MREIIWIGVAGSVGATLRYWLGMWTLHSVIWNFPFITFAINVCAAFMICFLSTGIFTKYHVSTKAQQIIIVGFLGSFSTMSAWSIETITLLQTGKWIVACSYILCSVFGGLAMGMLGDQCGRKLVLKYV